MSGSPIIPPQRKSGTIFSYAANPGEALVGTFVEFTPVALPPLQTGDVIEVSFRSTQNNFIGFGLVENSGSPPDTVYLGVEVPGATAVGPTAVFNASAVVGVVGGVAYINPSLSQDTVQNTDNWVLSNYAKAINSSNTGVAWGSSAPADAAMLGIGAQGDGTLHYLMVIVRRP